MARGGEDVSRLREELLMAQERIVQMENERLKQPSNRADQEDLQRVRLALYHRHMFQEPQDVQQGQYDNLGEADEINQPQMELLPEDEPHEEFQNLAPFLLDGEDDRLLDEDINEANPAAEQANQNPEGAGKDLNLDTLDDTVCVFCDSTLPPGAASSHYGSCPEYHRWSGTDSNDSFFYQPRRRIPFPSGST
ncbi:hypothetical protein BSL78_25383 [Apostichopus japonicus]|uniref:Uncharacterized protein n=1 Tax=Stichopus japonicus TaxID=307972 RepID=A0A2G8JQ30_STIJA|nr:hypothetical protein BSL78_25383 [Apostichopus japonicus]